MFDKIGCGFICALPLVLTVYTEDVFAQLNQRLILKSSSAAFPLG